MSCSCEKFKSCVNDAIKKAAECACITPDEGESMASVLVGLRYMRQFGWGANMQIERFCRQKAKAIGFGNLCPDKMKLYTQMTDVSECRGYCNPVTIDNVADGSDPRGCCDPVIIEPPETDIIAHVADVAAGKYHTAMVFEDGKVRTFGRGSNGQLGLGEAVKTANVPTLVKFPSAMQVTQVALGGNHTLFRESGGRVFATGLNSYGQLGIGKIPPSLKISSAVRVPSLEDVVQVGAGHNHSGALTREGILYTWGFHQGGMVGHKYPAARTADPTAFEISPRRVEALGKRVASFVLGDSHSIAIDHTGGVYSFGYGRHGQLGHGGFSNEEIPRKIEAFTERACQAAAGGAHTLILCSRGHAFAFGRGEYGQLGIDEDEDVCEPRRLDKLSGQRIVRVAAGENHTVVLTSTFKVWTSGCNFFKQLGHGHLEDEDSPEAVRALDGMQAFQIAAGKRQTMVVAGEMQTMVMATQP